MVRDVNTLTETAGNGPRWAMVVDLDRCTGCQACLVACHAENNVPVAGEAQAAYGRWLHWIIVQRYWEGEYPNVKARFNPVMSSSVPRPRASLYVRCSPHTTTRRG